MDSRLPATPDRSNAAPFLARAETLAVNGVVTNVSVPPQPPVGRVHDKRCVANLHSVLSGDDIQLLLEARRLGFLTAQDASRCLQALVDAERKKTKVDVEQLLART